MQLPFQAVLSKQGMGSRAGSAGYVQLSSYESYFRVAWSLGLPHAAESGFFSHSSARSPQVIRALCPLELTALRYKSRGEEAPPILYLALHSRRPGLIAITECHP